MGVVSAAGSVPAGGTSGRGVSAPSIHPQVYTSTRVYMGMVSLPLETFTQD